MVCRNERDFRPGRVAMPEALPQDILYLRGRDSAPRATAYSVRGILRIPQCWIWRSEKIWKIKNKAVYKLIYSQYLDACLEIPRGAARCRPSPSYIVSPRLDFQFTPSVYRLSLSGFSVHRSRISFVSVRHFSSSLPYRGALTGFVYR